MAAKYRKGTQKTQIEDFDQVGGRNYSLGITKGKQVEFSERKECRQGHKQTMHAQENRRSTLCQ